MQAVCLFALLHFEARSNVVSARFGSACRSAEADVYCLENDLARQRWFCLLSQCRPSQAPREHERRAVCAHRAADCHAPSHLSALGIAVTSANPVAAVHTVHAHRDRVQTPYGHTKTSCGRPDSSCVQQKPRLRFKLSTWQPTTSADLMAQLCTQHVPR